MPICTRVGLDKKAEPVESFQDDEKVFFCELTKEIFRDYEAYFQRVMLLNSTIWSCAATGKQNLTYAEALQSERKARKTGENLGDWFKAPVLMLVDEQKQTSFRVLLSKVFAFLKRRLFKGEEVYISKKKWDFAACKVIEIITPKEPPADGVYDPQTVKYKVQKIQNPSETWVTTVSQARRKRNQLTAETLKIFLKEHIIIGENSIRVKPESYDKYVASKDITFESIYVGKMPKWEPGKKFGKGLVQSSMGSYVVHDAENSQKELENLKEAMERMRREKEEKQAELERKRAETMAKIEEEAATISRKCDDLERPDQRVLPMYKPVKTIVASKYFSEFLMIREFLHSFAPILSASDVFRTNITFHQMCRAFLNREVAGPLSDILQVLLSSIFALQIEENDDCPIKYAKTKKDGLVWTAANRAVDCHSYVKNYLALNLFELPIDAQTLTEILRLHLLSSGAPNDEKSEAYRYQYRNGYSVSEDPGLLLRIQYPHILRALKMYTIYQLPFKDILKVLNCLMEQILTYNASIASIEERLENLAKTRHNMRMFLARENKRAQQVQNTKKTLLLENQTQMLEHKDNEEKRGELERALARKMKDLDEQDGRERGNFEYELNNMTAEMFSYMTLLGTDRAYRNYYVFESLPGLFIEHATEDAMSCLEQPPKHDPELVDLPKDRNKVKAFFLHRYKQSDKENMKKSNAAAGATANGEIVKMNGSLNPIETNDKALPKPTPTPTELYMCSGNPSNCIVHDPKHQDRNRWSFINTNEELDALIEALNPCGYRESNLKETLIKLKKHIVPHMEKCPVQILTVDLAEREQSIAQMLSETQKKYANSNFGFLEDADINEVMHSTLTRQILEFETEISDGNLGKMKISDLEKWRQDLSEGKYNSQCKKLSYGPEAVNGNGAPVFEDPGNDLGDTLDVESEDSADEAISTHDSPTMRQNVSNLASALLQIEQSIEKRFLKEPFGVKVEVKDKNEMDAKMAAGKARLQQWEVSLMNATSYSQVFLHLNILSDAVKWFRSSMKSSCLICRRKGDADKLLLCDECNAGTHMFCMKPKMKKIPEGNWYCFRCELKLGLNKPADKQKKKAKKVFSMDDDEDAEQAKESDDEDVPLKMHVKTDSRTKRGSTVNGKKNSKKIESEDEEEIEDEEIEEAEEEEDGEEAEEEGDNDEEAESSSDEASESSDDEVISKLAERKRAAQTNGKQRAKKAASEREDVNEDEEASLETSDEEDNLPLISNGHLKKNEKKRLDKKVVNDSTVDDTGMSSSDEDKCKHCKSSGTDLSCNACKDCYHLECTGLRRMPRGNWLCSPCKSQAEKKRRLIDSDSESSNDETSDSYQAPPSKRQRRSNHYEATKNNNNSRRSRRSDESLKLDTIALYDLLDLIMKHEDAWPFLRPVMQGEVPDYHKIIKNPMDFARIKSNLNMCRYTTNEEVIRDIQLVFMNCDTYNPPGNEIYKSGASLERFVAEKCKEINLKYTPSDMIIDRA